jgi:hypothetical protein
MIRRIALARTLSPHQPADRDDVLGTRTALRTLGFDTGGGLTPKTDTKLFGGIKAFQKANGLAVDGVMKPNGPTHRRVNALLDKRSGASDDNRGRFTAATGTKAGESAFIQNRLSAAKAPKPKARPTAPTRSATRPAPLHAPTPKPTPSNSAAIGRQTRSPFRLREAVESNVSVTPQDSKRTKRALNRLGYLKTPEWGLTGYPTEDMFDGLETFQRDHKLRPDRMMRPEGPTERMLEKRLAERAIDVDEDTDVDHPETRTGAFNRSRGVDQDGNRLRLADAPKDAEVSAGTDGNSEGSGDAVAPASENPESKQSEGKSIFDGIDLNRVHANEGRSIATDGYIPEDNDGNPMQNSGVTVGWGVDIGQIDDAELDNWGTDYGVSRETLDKLRPYVGKKKEDAKAFLAENPLTLTEDEAIQVSRVKYAKIVKRLKDNVETIRGPGAWDTIPGDVRTVLLDVAVNAGPNAFNPNAEKGSKRHDNMIGFIRNGDVAGMIDELRAYGMLGLQPRRTRNAEWLEKALQAGTLKPTF